MAENLEQQDIFKDYDDDQLQRIYISLFTQNQDDNEPSGCDSEFANSLKEELEKRSLHTSI